MQDYETIRKKNLEDNKRILASFGLLDPFKSLPNIVKRNRPTLKKPPATAIARKRPAESEAENFVGGSIHGLRRKSARLEGKDASETSYQNNHNFDEEEDEKPTPKVPPKRPNFYGAIPDVEVGTMWSTRMECCRDGVHRPTVAGIHGGEDGAYSIALSGGYEDDVDLGECFTYTGEGGRDLKGTKSNPKNLRTAPQSKDQTLSRGNLALSRNAETGNPVRVIRGYKLDSPFAPEDGYRYDGLYSVEKSWFTTGLSGFGVWKFALKRCDNQAPPPWQFDSEQESPSKISPSASNGNIKEEESISESTQSSAEVHSVLQSLENDAIREK